MIPSGLFRNRWTALFWAAGILWTAYDVASGQTGDDAPAANSAAAPVDATGEAINAADLAILANAGG